MTCYWEPLNEYIENLGNFLETTWEHNENTMGTKKTKKKTPSPKPKIKKLSLFEHSHWLHEFLFPKRFVTICNLA
jgi:hypothetical protein